MAKKKLLIEQLETRIKLLAPAGSMPNPSTGWIRAIRLSLGMTLQQLGNKLSVTKQSVRDMEMREREGAITLKSLRDTARAMEMDLVYGFVPKEGSLDKYIEKRARDMAEQIVKRTSVNMKLEDQKVSEERIQRAIDERTALIKSELPKSLWD